MTTFADLLTKIETELSLLGGIDVQTYGRPKLAAKLQRTFNEVYDKRFWKDYRQFKTFTTNGVNGLPVGLDVNDVKRFADIEYIWRQAEDRPLPEVPTRVNPTRVTRLSFAPNNVGSTKFVILPMTYADTFCISFRSKPNALTDDDEVPFDDDYLTAMVCADFLIDEGANKEAAQKFAKIAETRLQTLMDNETQNDKAFESYTATHLTEWR